MSGSEGQRGAAAVALEAGDALYLLCFDHRNSYTAGIFNFALPLSAAQAEEVSDSKQVIYQGFKRALKAGVPERSAGIAVDEEFGACILADAGRRGLLTALSVEESGDGELEFEYGADFAHRIETIDPGWVKVRVRYNPEDDPALDQRERSRLSELSAFCRQSARRLLVELRVPATEAQMRHIDGDEAAYVAQMRPGLMQRAIRTLQDAGVEPDVWAVEACALRGDCERVVEAARHDGRDAVRCIVLADAVDAAQRDGLLDLAAGVDGFIGFAVGRSVFWNPMLACRARTLTRAAAAAQIAARYRECVGVFERGRAAWCAAWPG
jgi:myo-inositol catabolism protein IolC